MDDPLGDAFPCDGAETGGTEVASSGRSMGAKTSFYSHNGVGFSHFAGVGYYRS